MDRNWEADVDIARDSRPDGPDCPDDIARQLVYSEPGNKIQVVLGGGRRNFLKREGSTEENPGKREDEDLTEAYQRMNERDGVSYRQGNFFNSCL